MIALLISLIEASEPGAGIPNVGGGAGVPVAAAYQPTAQGVPTVATAFLFKIGDVPVGYPFLSDIYDPDEEAFVHTEVQIYETTFQLSALVPQNPATPTQKTASDVINLLRYIMQSQATIVALRAQGLGVLRVSTVRNPYFTDDRDRFEASPSFDFTITHKQIVESEVPVLQSTEFEIVPV